jgi:hypothetical protein
LESGKSLPPGSSCSGTPISRKNATVSSTEKPRGYGDEVRRPPQKSFRHDGVRDVAAAAADENLGAWTSGAVEQDDGRVRVKTSSEDCRRETGGAGADDRNITRARTRGQIRSLRRADRSFDEDCAR